MRAISAISVRKKAVRSKKRGFHFEIFNGGFLTPETPPVRTPLIQIMLRQEQAGALPWGLLLAALQLARLHPRFFFGGRDLHNRPTHNIEHLNLYWYAIVAYLQLCHVINVFFLFGGQFSLCIRL